jgi:hypothetical protein
MALSTRGSTTPRRLIWLSTILSRAQVKLLFFSSDIDAVSQFGDKPGKFMNGPGGDPSLAELFDFC